MREKKPLGNFDVEKLLSFGIIVNIGVKVTLDYEEQNIRYFGWNDREKTYHSKDMWYTFYVETDLYSFKDVSHSAESASRLFERMIQDISKYFEVPGDYYNDFVSRRSSIDWCYDASTFKEEAKNKNPFSSTSWNNSLSSFESINLRSSFDRSSWDGKEHTSISEPISSVVLIDSVFYSRDYIRRKKEKEEEDKRLEEYKKQQQAQEAIRLRELKRQQQEYEAELRRQQEEQEAIRLEEYRKQQEEQKKEEEKREREYGWFNLSSNNVDMRLPTAALTKSQQNQIARICSSQSITIFEDFDEQYCIMYFEIQPSSFAESMRFAFKQVANSEERLSVRNTKECRNCALRAIMPIFELLSQNYEKLEEEKIFDLVDGKLDRLCLKSRESQFSNTFGTINAEKQNRTIFRPIQLFIPPGAHKCALSDGKEGDYDDYKAFIECGFDVGDSTNYIYYENSLTENDDNYWQCPVPNDVRRKAKRDIINVLKNAGFSADFELIEKFKSKRNKTLIMNR